MKNENVYFYEKQRFGQVLLWLLLADVMFTLGLVYLVLAVSDTPAEPSESIPAAGIAAGAIVLVSAAIAVFLLAVRLETEVRRDGLYVRFFPLHLHFKKFALEEIAQYSVRCYHPLLEYGGWGIRYSFSRGKAYNLRGSEGLQLVFKNGRQLLIGTQEPTKLAAAVDQATGRSG